MRILIEFRGVSKTYDNGTKALKNVSLKIEKGEFVFVVGASGAGKSTFLKLIMHEETPNSGKVIVNNYDLTAIKRKEVPYLRRTMGIVFQDFRLIQKMTIYDNVAFAMRIVGAREKEIRKRVPYILGLVALSTKARCYPCELSGGEQQRVSLARALVNNPSMIIADEPTGNIDPEMSFEIVDLLSRINSYGTTIVMVTHEHDLVRQFNKRVIVIENGCILSDNENAENLDYTSEKNAYDYSFYSGKSDPDVEKNFKDQKSDNNKEVEDAQGAESDNDYSFYIENIESDDEAQSGGGHEDK